MATKIGWAQNPDGTPGETWNPTVGCTRVSPGCDHCYASTLHNSRYRSNVKATLDFEGGLSSPAELRGVEELPYPAQYDQPFATVQMLPDRLDIPLRRWKTTPKRIFVDSMADLFHADVTDEFLDRVFATMALASQHTFQVLTKRPERMREYLRDPDLRGRIVRGLGSRPSPGSTWLDRQGGRKGLTGSMSEVIEGLIPIFPLPNVWLGVSVENQEEADRRIPILLDTPAAVRWISAEPLLGRLNLCGPDYQEETCALHGRGPRLLWVVVGAESGAKRRPMKLAWMDGIVDQCLAANVPVFVKQDGAFAPGKQGRIPDNVWNLKQFPGDRHA